MRTTSLPRKDGVPPSITTGWPTYGGGLGNTGYVDTETPETAELGLYYRHYVEGQYSIHQPAIVDDTIYTGSANFLYALDAATGEERWKTDVGSYTHSISPTVSDGRVFIGSREVTDTKLVRQADGTFYALDAADGEILWETSASVTAGATVHDGIAYVPSTPTDPVQRGVLQALDAATGEEIWRFDVEGARADADTAAFAEPALDTETNTVYLTSTSQVSDEESGFVHAIDAAAGEERWRFATEGDVRSAPVLADDRVYAGDGAGMLYALTTDGDEVWRQSIGEDGVDATPVVAPELDAVCASSVGNIARVSASSGETDWTLDIQDVRRAGLAAAGESLYVGGSPFLVVNIASGELEAEVPVDGLGGAYGQPTVSDGAVYVCSCVKQGEDLLYDNYIYVMG